MEKIVFFLGAGASVDAGAPLVSNFVETIMRAIAAGRVDPEDAQAFEDRLRAVGGSVTSNIEELLRAADHNTLWHASRAIGATLAWRIGFEYSSRRIASREASYKELARLLRDVAERDPAGAAVVTVNYDLCADVAILDSGGGRIPFYCLARREARSSASGGGAPEIALAKLHGSLNWHGCVGTGCGRVCADPHISEFVEKHGAAWPEGCDHHLEFPVPSDPCTSCGRMLQGPCPSCQQPLENPLIVPPVQDKAMYQGDMRVIWDNAEDLVREASLVVVVGYSCNPIDGAVNALLRFVHAGQRVLIANPSRGASGTALHLMAGADVLGAVLDLRSAIEKVRGLLSLPGSPSTRRGSA